MRSPLKTTTIAALALAMLTGGAFAADHHDFGRDNDKGAYTGDYYQGIFGMDDMTTPARPMVTAPARVASSRLDRVLHELKTHNRQIKADRAEGRLTVASYNKLEREDAMVRAQAIKTAAAHNGMLPAQSYARLQNEVRRLDRDMSRMA
ncbi:MULTISPECIES: hypothetical protein [unclassified Ensifer]|uniref:hypothetical protein n=1 Tax=unclassified Ensifer TaxID=2633371 RepID=UPI000813BB3A|nr:MULTISPECIES: hypothetical protein [unclassified Ensifer]OCO99896.1 hypothetical protein BC374_08130 [Ensifer sp. LC13]OCP00163.1 hypothetical protein BBX50_08885 [Ensifer sp. LC11]OCP03982.1 hypothetical protein BC362_16550 [Ensifer sp. LC14]OCP31054.1 hypothetical protein BC364_04380 [Ensifer sp. LC499]